MHYSNGPMSNTIQDTGVWHSMRNLNVYNSACSQLSTIRMTHILGCALIEFKRSALVNQYQVRGHLGLAHSEF